MEERKMMRKAQEKILVSLATIGKTMGNRALAGPCYWGVYEPKKPDILKNKPNDTL